MTLVADMRSPRLWHLWSTEYGYGTDAADEGFIVRTEHGWALHRRRGRSGGAVYPTLDEALGAVGIVRGDHEVRHLRS